ncbi:DUF4199 domain-containing protein [Litoribacter ruber]|uniref:DUF4199 domain-containing protein n=1 Tax=Litoribacter ruber TaxID=702568 RepID=A0AAP2CM02_9BACT|nr:MULTISPECIES: DUF4199 domain-containing protein [Litoribacter]MBS9525030.1 DUF4199 domain-containing protein [Litoribacter alkaliphilus]MBT0811812.1 DUF4199 domain-containing protein [Litoribacter ruber]
MENYNGNSDVEVGAAPFQAAFKTGIVLGLITVVAYFILYFIDSTLLASGYVGLVLVAVMVGVIMIFGIEYRKELGGYMTFGVAFQFVFIALLISSLISTGGNVLLFHIIDPNLPTVLADAQMESTLAIMERFGGAGAIGGEEIDKLREGFYDNYTIVGMIKSLGVSVIISAILALILGAILKKRDKSLDY